MNINSSFIRHVIAPFWAYYEKSPYLKISRSLKINERMSPDERLIRQWEKLVSIIRLAFVKSPYYKKKFLEIGFHPDDLKSWEDLKLLPILTKEEIREFSNEMIVSDVNKRDLVPRMTSGSTGTPLYFFVSDSDFQFKRGVTLYRDGWTGWKLGELKAILWGGSISLANWRSRLRNTFLERIIGLDTLKIDDETLHDFIREIFNKKPTLLFGHAHSLYLLADFWKKENYQPFHFKGILSTAMVLHGHERALCEEIFQSPVFDRYGCEEVSLIASECEAHKGLHINTDNLVVEILKDTKRVGPDEEGAIVITDLTNSVMPFIRYQVGDMGIFSSEICPCGRTYPLLRKVAGRIADYLMTPDGKWVSGISLTDHFATMISDVRQFQIVQKIKDHLELRIVPLSDSTDLPYEQIKFLVEKYFGPHMRYDIQKIQNLSPEKSGKYRFTICELNDEKKTYY